MSDIITRFRSDLAIAIAKNKQYSATSLARAIGRDGTYLRDFMSGKKSSIGASEITSIEALLGERLWVGKLPEDEAFEQQEPASYRPPPVSLADRDLPIFASTEGGPGAMVVTNDILEMVQRPWYMRDVVGYGVLVTGDSMIPAFYPGDIAVVNPKLPVFSQKNAIFVAGEDRGDFTASIKQFVRQDRDYWHVRQHNPPDGQSRDLKFDRKEWTKALRVVGKYES